MMIISSYGIAAKRVMLPESVTSIAANAFAACPNLMGIYIPKGCKSIDPSAFNDSIYLIIYSTNDSYARTYAEEFGYGFIAID